ncbi:SDR family NAD(P)-dependent oxidoreductase, partial [Streptomyces sp. SID10244]|nr:SDR family NAD(P)-dependent oxidoreductase [Streptomyces sp. SID10244]
LTGRAAVVTGAAGGIGSAVAAALATAGAAVMVTDVNESAAAEVAEKISLSGGKADSMALDVSDRDAADGVMSRAAALGDGHVHIVVNN